MNLKIEKIKELEIEIKAKKKSYKKLYEEYDSDGIIDKIERKKLNGIKGKIETVEKLIEKLKAEVEKNKKIWEGRSRDYNAIRDQLNDLELFGLSDAELLAKEIAGIPDAVKDQRWADAIAILDQGEVGMGPAWKDYETQKKAKESYDPLRLDFDTRLAGAEIGEPQTDAVSGRLGTISANIGAIDAQTDAVHYVDALAMLKLSITELETAETELTRVQVLHAAYLDQLDKLGPKLVDCSVSDFSSLSAKQEKIATGQAAMENAAGANDFDLAKTEQDKLVTLVDEFLPAQEALATAREMYERDNPKIRNRLTAVSGSQLGVEPSALQAVADAQAVVDTAIALDDYVIANDGLINLETAISVVEASVDAKTYYETRLSGLKSDLVAASVSDGTRAYLSSIQSDMADLQSDMETAADVGDFETALDFLGRLEDKLIDYHARINEKQAEYTKARRDLDTAMERNRDYPGFAGPQPKMEAALKAVDDAAVQEDWVGAVDKMKDVYTEITLRDTDIVACEAQLLSEIAKIEPGVRKILDENKDSKSQTKKNLIKLLAKFDAARKAPQGLPQAEIYIAQAETLAKELEEVAAVIDRLDTKWGFSKDDEARDIVNELSATNKLKTLPVEAQNRLVQELMGNDEVSEADHDAIQEIWSTPTIDRQFEEFDEQTRHKISNAFKEDPDVQIYAANWDGMDPSEKEAALRKLVEIPMGKDGWDVGEIGDVNADPSAFELNPQRGGQFDPVLNDININFDSELNENFTEVVMSVTHEVAHRYQHKLVARMKGEVDPPLEPGTPEYEEAKALELNQRYMSEHNKEWKDMVKKRDGAPFYSGTPGETQSRQSANHMNNELTDAFGPGDPQPL